MDSYLNDIYRNNESKNTDSQMDMEETLKVNRNKVMAFISSNKFRLYIILSALSILTAIVNIYLYATVDYRELGIELSTITSSIIGSIIGLVIVLIIQYILWSIHLAAKSQNHYKLQKFFNFIAKFYNAVKILLVICAIIGGLSTVVLLIMSPFLGFIMLLIIAIAVAFGLWEISVMKEFYNAMYTFTSGGNVLAPNPSRMMTLYSVLLVFQGLAVLGSLPTLLGGGTTELLSEYYVMIPGESYTQAISAVLGMIKIVLAYILLKNYNDECFLSNQKIPVKQAEELFNEIAE